MQRWRQSVEVKGDTDRISSNVQHFSSLYMCLNLFFTFEKLYFIALHCVK